MAISSIPGREDWNRWNAAVPMEFDPEALNFRDLFDAYLQPGGSCFEVGCYPGRFLIYLCRRFGYTANGIDLTPLVRTRMPEFLRDHGVQVGDIHCADFQTFRCERTFDVVCSFGFIEHFENLEEIIQRHISLVRVGGTLILACPNFRGLQFLFHRIFDAENLRRHIVSTMSLRRWRDVLAKNRMRVIYDGYYRTMDFWIAPEEARGLRGSVAGSISRVAKRLDQHMQAPTPWLSPFLVSISRKTDEGPISSLHS